jgi:hypothetical protein
MASSATSLKQLDKHKKYKNFHAFRRPRNKALKSLNNVYLVTDLTYKSLRRLQNRLENHEEDYEFAVPSKDGTQSVLSRDKSQISKLLKHSLTFGIHEQALITAVALTEDYLQKSLRLILAGFPKKLKIGIGGNATDKTVSIDLILNVTSRQQILRKLIEKQLLSWFYSSPGRYFEYLEQVTAIAIPEQRKTAFQEIKATRDIIIHNSSLANEMYLEKSGSLSRAKIGERVEVNVTYFFQSVALMKALIQGIYESLLDKYGETKLDAGSS